VYENVNSIDFYFFIGCRFYFASKDNVAECILCSMMLYETCAGLVFITKTQWHMTRGFQMEYRMN
jgi:hypothetical protein